MWRNAVRVLVIAGLIGAGWVAGRAQSVAPDFELVVSAPAGSAQITCIRGCAITWAPFVQQPTSGPIDIHVPTAKLQGAVSTTNAEGCVAPTWSTGHCRIWGFVKR